MFVCFETKTDRFCVFNFSSWKLLIFICVNLKPSLINVDVLSLNDIMFLFYWNQQMAYTMLPIFVWIFFIIILYLIVLWIVSVGWVFKIFLLCFDVERSLTLRNKNVLILLKWFVSWFCKARKSVCFKS